MSLYIRKVVVDLSMLIMYLGIISLEYSAYSLYFHIPLYMAAVVGLTSYCYFKIRTFILVNIDYIIDTKLKTYFLYLTLNQVSGDLMRNHMVYFEFKNPYGVLISGKVKLNAQSLMEITLRNQEVQIIDDPDYQRTVNSVIELFLKNNAIVVRAEPYFEALRKHKYKNLTF